MNSMQGAPILGIRKMISHYSTRIIRINTRFRFVYSKGDGRRKGVVAFVMEIAEFLNKAAVFYTACVDIVSSHVGLVGESIMR